MGNFFGVFMASSSYQPAPQPWNTSYWLFQRADTAGRIVWAFRVYQQVRSVAPRDQFRCSFVATQPNAVDELNAKALADDQCQSDNGVGVYPEYAGVFSATCNWQWVADGWWEPHIN